MFRRSHAVIPRSTTHLAKRLAQPFFRRKLLHATRVLWPTLVALTFTSVAHAQGTMDFSGAQTLMGTFKDAVAETSLPARAATRRIHSVWSPTPLSAWEYSPLDAESIVRHSASPQAEFRGKIDLRPGSCIRQSEESPCSARSGSMSGAGAPGHAARMGLGCGSAATYDH